MTSDVEIDAPGFWYEESFATGVDVLNALRRFRTAEAAAQRRVRDALGLGDNALLALRILVAADREGFDVNSRELADRLGITSASTSGLVDRLVRGGYIVRRADPSDRRGVLLEASGPSMPEARSVIEDLDNAMDDVLDALPPTAVSTIIAFFDAMTNAVLNDEKRGDPDGMERFPDSSDLVH